MKRSDDVIGFQVLPEGIVRLTADASPNRFRNGL